MGIPRIDTGPMTISEFYAFTDTRPDEERWELIEGEPVLNASASRLHQIIAANVIFLLKGALLNNPSWEVLPRLGLKVSDINRPEPDIMIRPKREPAGESGRDCDDAVVLFEILSPSTANRDLRWKRKAYALLPSVSDYAVIAQDAVEVVVYERKTGFAERRLESAGAALELTSIGVTLPLADIYRDTGLGEK
jgi:Uma2 family endonuclease